MFMMHFLLTGILLEKKSFISVHALFKEILGVNESEAIHNIKHVKKAY
jgi:hypothetical protein